MGGGEKVLIHVHRGSGGKFMKTDKAPEQLAHTGCKECARKDLYRWLEEMVSEVPMPDNPGFGKHNDYVQGMLDGIGAHISSVISELKHFEKDMLKEGDLEDEHDA